jgi:hypothetical protein
MKHLTPVLIGLALLGCTQPPQQYSEASPEIELAKKANAAYMAGNWEALRATYADTAKIAANEWTPDKWLTVDQAIEAWKADREVMPQVKLSDDAIYNMITTNSGETWVLNWLNWTGRTKDGKEASSPAHLAFRMAGGKIAFVAIFFNNLPPYLATQPPAAEPAPQP